MFKIVRYLSSGIILTLFFTSSNLAFGKTVGPSIDIVSSLPSDNPPSIIAGHSFIMTATSINGGSGEVHFAATDSGIKLNPASCIVNPNGYCQVTATVTLGTPPNLHELVANYQSAGNTIELTRYQFKSYNPELELVDQPKAASIRKGESTNMSFDLSAASIPEGEGVVKVIFSYTPSNIILGQGSCSIEYKDNKISNNKCRNLPFFGIEDGVSHITATANGFNSPQLPPIVVPNKFVYILGVSEISMFGELNNGSLVPIKEHRTNPDNPLIPVEGIPGQMVVRADGRFLYVTDTENNKVVPYAIDLATGLPVVQNNLKVSTGNRPIKITFSPNERYAYVTNYGSSTISQYIINKSSGAFTPNNPATIAAGLSPDSLVITPNMKFAYTLNYNSVTKYKLNADNGKLALDSTLTPPGSGSGFRSLAMEPAGRSMIFITNPYNIRVLELTVAGHVKKDYFDIAYPMYIPTGVQFNPMVLPNGTNLAYLTTDSNLIIYQIKSPGDFETLDTLSWNIEQNGPNTMGIDPTGQYVYIAHQYSKTITGYKVDIHSTGKMVHKTTTDSPIVALGIVISPDYVSSGL